MEQLVSWNFINLLLRGDYLLMGIYIYGILSENLINDIISYIIMLRKWFSQSVIFSADGHGM